MKTVKEECDKLRLANDNLVRQLERENATRLSEIGKEAMAKSELRRQIAELECSLQSRRGSNGVEEIAEYKEKLIAENERIAKMVQTSEADKKLIEELRAEIENKGQHWMSAYLASVERIKVLEEEASQPQVQYVAEFDLAEKDSLVQE